MRTFIAITFLLFVFFSEAKTTAKKSQSQGTQLLESLPVKFIENKGQLADMNGAPIPYVWFKASAPGIDLYLTDKGLTYVFLKCEEDEDAGSEDHGAEMKEEKHWMEWEKVEMTLKGADLKKENIITEGAGEMEYNYFLAHCISGITGVKQYDKVTIKNVYPGIDWVFYNSGKKGFKYDFIVHPGADASMIKMSYTSRKPLQLDESGQLFIKTGLGTLSENAPYSFNREVGQPIASGFVLDQHKLSGHKFQSVVSFTFGAHRTDQTMVVDPSLVWGTFYGGTSFEGTYCIDMDAAGNMFMCGYTASTNLPLVDIGGYYQSANNVSFILKFSGAGALLWASYLGNGNGLTAATLDVDKFGNVFVVGVVSGTVCPLLNANTYFQGVNGGSQDACILKFSNNGALLWGTYYGGSSSDRAHIVSTDNNGNVFVAGVSSSTNFPLQNANTYYNGTSSSSNAFILKFDNAGNRLWATFYDKLVPYGMINDHQGNLIITGNAQSGFSLLNPGGGAYFQTSTSGFSDIGILKFDNSGNQFWSTFYGGAGTDDGRSVVVDNLDNIFISGATTSTDFPVQNAGTYFQGSLNGTYDVYILKFNPSGVRLWASYYGGSKVDQLSSGDNLVVDTCNNVYMTFETTSSDLPIKTSCDGGFQDNFRDTSISLTNRELFITRFSSTGTLLWSTYFGGSGNDFRIAAAIDPQNQLVLTGEWVPSANQSTTYPVVKAAGAYLDSTGNGSDDVYIVKFHNNVGSAPPFSYVSPVCTNHSVDILPVSSSTISSFGIFSSAPGLSLDPTTGAITPSASIPGTYTVSLPASVCFCSTGSLTETSTTVTISAPPVIVFTGTNTICIKNSGTVTASGATSYTWHTGAHTNSLVLVTPSSNTILTVTGTGTNGCTTTNSVLVKVNSCQGLEEFVAGESRLRVYANPNRGDFIISSDKDQVLNLVNVLGQPVREIVLNETNGREVHISGLATGIYFLRNTDGATKIDHKIVVER